MWCAVAQEEESEAGEGHVELITYLQLLGGHGGQSRHVVGEVAGAHVNLGVSCLIVVPHGQTLEDERGGGWVEVNREAGLVNSKGSIASPRSAG